MGMQGKVGRRAALAVGAAAAAVAPFVIADPAGAQIYTDDETATLSFQNFNGVGQTCNVFASATLDTATHVLTTTGSSECTVTMTLTLTYEDKEKRTHTLRARGTAFDIDLDHVFAPVQAVYEGTFSACVAGPPGQTCSTSATVAPK